MMNAGQLSSKIDRAALGVIRQGRSRRQRTACKTRCVAEWSRNLFHEKGTCLHIPRSKGGGRELGLYYFGDPEAPPPKMRAPPRRPTVFCQHRVRPWWHKNHEWRHHAPPPLPSQKDNTCPLLKFHSTPSWNILSWERFPAHCLIGRRDFHPVMEIYYYILRGGLNDPDDPDDQHFFNAT